MDTFRRHPSRVTTWIDGDLRPIDTGDSEVWFVLPEEDDAGLRYWEALNAHLMEDGSAEIRAVPALADGLAFGDRVSVLESGEGALVATDIVGRGDYATFRVWLGAHPGEVDWRNCAELFARLGCFIDVYTESLVAIACRAAEVHAVRAELEGFTQSGDFMWEESHTPENV